LRAVSGTNRIQAVARSPIRISVVAVILAALAPGSSAAAASASPLSASGSVTGTLQAGRSVQVRLTVRHTGGWQQVSEVEIDLDLRGRPLEQLVIDPTHDAVVLAGEAGPAALGEHLTFTGVYFVLNPAAITLTARGQRISLSIPIRIRTDPPPAARLTLQARGFDVTQTRPIGLTAPVHSSGGFSWGTLAAAIAGALFAGGFLGGLFASRRRPPARPSIYAAVQRRLEQERSTR
jgi:hypothetical protein